LQNRGRIGIAMHVVGLSIVFAMLVVVGCSCCCCGWKFRNISFSFHTSGMTGMGDMAT
jgi:hypothetical protein